MAVLLETSKGDIVIDLFVEDCPMTCKNFLKLCKCVKRLHSHHT
jgi:peptidyl-prolyl cis-trans isomerase-like 4